MQTIKEQEYIEKYVMTKQELEEKLGNAFNKGFKKGKKQFALELYIMTKNFPYKLTTWRALDLFASQLLKIIKNEVERS